MTDVNAIKEAIDALTCGFLDVCDIDPYMDTILRALEKQVPKKPNMNVEENYLGEYTFYHCDCPTCGEFIEGGRTRHPHHCPCGQTLDWSADE